MLLIVNDQGIGIIKGCGGGCEEDSVFVDVDEVLVGIVFNKD